MSTSADPSATTPSHADDYAELKHYVAEIVEDFSALKKVAARLVANQAHSRIEHVEALVDQAREVVADYHERANVVIRDRPFVAIGAAFVAGALLASRRRR